MAVLDDNLQRIMTKKKNCQQFLRGALILHPARGTIYQIPTEVVASGEP